MEHKYLKYKKKYLDLSQDIKEQNGGNIFRQYTLFKTDEERKIFILSLYNCSDIIYYLEKYSDLYSYVNKSDNTIYEYLLLKLNINSYIDGNDNKARVLINACKKYNKDKINNFKISQIKQLLINIAKKVDNIGNSAINAVNHNLDKLNDADIMKILYFAENYNIRLSWLIEVLVNNRLDDFIKELHNIKRENKTPLSNEDLENAYKKLGLIMHKS